jgi:hypothetical protein
MADADASRAALLIGSVSLGLVALVAPNVLGTPAACKRVIWANTTANSTCYINPLDRACRYEKSAAVSNEKPIYRARRKLPDSNAGGRIGDEANEVVGPVSEGRMGSSSPGSPAALDDGRQTFTLRTGRSFVLSNPFSFPFSRLE